MRCSTRWPKSSHTRWSIKLAVRAMPGSGTPAELLAAAGIDADHIAAAARELAGRAGAQGRSKAEVGSGRRE